MNDANISWYVEEEDNVFVPHTEYYAGTCIPNRDFTLNVQLWNNRWNISEDVNNMNNTRLIISFSNIEDSALLNICSVSINNGAYNKVTTEEFDRAIIDLGMISGARNNGSDENVDNYKSISIRFNNVQNGFKDGLKSMFLDVQFE